MSFLGYDVITCDEGATQAYMEIRRGADDEANEDSALIWKRNHF